MPEAQQAPPRVLVTPHARDAAWTRLGDGQTDGRIKADVSEAIVEGRRSRRRPRWLDLGTRKTAHGPDTFFAWPAGRDRVFVCKPDGGRIVVLTVLVPNFSRLGIGRAGAAA